MHIDWSLLCAFKVLCLLIILAKVGRRIQKWSITRSDRQKQEQDSFTWQKITCSTPFQSLFITTNTMLPVRCTSFSHREENKMQS